MPANDRAQSIAKVKILSIIFPPAFGVALAVALFYRTSPHRAI
jgi:hypothetical protein